LVLKDFEMTSEAGTSSLVVQVVDVMDRARGMALRALHLGVQRSFVIVHSHYEKCPVHLVGCKVAEKLDL
jgi:peptide deformylase